VLPILLLLVFGIIQFGIILNGQVTVTSAAREGVRLAVVGGTQEEIKNRVDESENEGFNKKLFYVIKDVFGNFSYRRSFNLLKDEIYKEYEIILLMHRTAPKLLGLEGSSGESMLQVIVEESEGIKKKEPVSHYSPYLKILSGLSSEDQNFHIFLIGRRVRQNQNAVTQIKSKLLDFFVSCYNDVEVE